MTGLRRAIRHIFPGWQKGPARTEVFDRPRSRRR